MVLLFHLLKLAVEVFIYFIINCIVVVVFVNFNLEFSFGWPHSSRRYAIVSQVFRYFFFALLQNLSGHTLAEWVLFRLVVVAEFFIKFVQVDLVVISLNPEEINLSDWFSDNFFGFVDR